jgi:hypothetical protein
MFRKSARLLREGRPGKTLQTRYESKRLAESEQISKHQSKIINIATFSVV